MNSKVICVNDFPEVAFPPEVPDDIVEEQRKKLQAKYDSENLDFRHPIKRHVHTETVTWYPGENTDGD